MYHELYNLLKRGYETTFRKKVVNSPEFCCTVNKLIEEYLDEHEVTTLPFVANCAALPAANLYTADIYVVLASTGTPYIPSWLGGSFCPKGLWRSNGVTWDYLGEFTFQASQVQVDAGLVSDRWVSPLTLENASKWLTKNDSIQFQDETINLGASGTVDTINFTGNVNVSRVGDVLTVNVPIIPDSYAVNNVNFAASPYNEVATSGEVFSLVDTTAGVVIYNLPTAIGNNSKLTITKTDASANTVDITPFGAQTVSGSVLLQILFQNSSVELMSNGANWYIT